MRKLTATGAIGLFLFLLTSCGGGGSESFAPAPSPPPSFSISLSPSTSQSSPLTIVMGSPGSEATVTVTGHNGFTGSVNLSVNGLPTGVFANPNSWTIAAGQSQKVVFTADADAPVADFQATNFGSSGALSASAALFGKVVLPPNSSVIGPAGGTFAVTDSSSPLFGVTLEVPAGALSQNVLIQLALDVNAPFVPGVVFEGIAIDLFPSGLLFAVPAVLSIPYPDVDGNGIVDGTEIEEQFVQTRVFDANMEGWFYVPGIVDEVRNLAVSEIEHFSLFRLYAFRFPSNKVITYRFGSLPTHRSLGITDEAVKSATSKALDTWAQQLAGVGITFDERPDELFPDIVFAWNSELFLITDLASEIFRIERALAWTQYVVRELGNIVGLLPSQQIFFNDRVTWAINPNDNQNTANIGAVAAHEIGHALGLSHSKGFERQPPLMAATGSVRNPIACLAAGDVRDLRQLYGISLLLPGQFPSIPCLNRPIPNESITQNNPNIDCPAHPTGGFGFQIRFDWADSFSLGGIAGYGIFAKQKDAVEPAVDTFVNSSDFTYTACNVFVTDSNLSDWEWRVRARDSQDVLSEWSIPRPFEFEPCRLADGSPCFSVPPAPLPDLAIAKTDSPDPVTSSGTLTYSITVQNIGSGAAADVSVSDTLPAGVIFQSCSVPCGVSGNAVSVSLGTMAAAATTSFNIVVTAPAVTTPTDITNTASVSTTSSESDTTNNQASQTTTVHPPPTIISFTPTSGPVGTPVTITGTNFSPTPDGNAVKFNGVPATVTSSTSTTILTAVPAEATNGPITVATAFGTASSSTNFTVTIVAPKAYVNNFGSNSVSVIDVTGDSVFTTISVGLGPGPIRLTPDAAKAYVGNFNTNSVSVISTATDTVINTIQVGFGPCNIVVTPDGTKAYATNFNSASVSVIDTTTDTVIKTIQVATQPCALSVSPSGAKVYVANQGGGSVSVIETATDTVTKTIPVGSSPFPVVFTPDGTKAYVVNGLSNSISVIDVASDTETKRVDVGVSPRDIGIRPDGSKAYVVNFGSTFTLSSVSVIDIPTDTVISTIGIGGFDARVIALTPDGAKGYVAHTGSPFALGDISVIDTATDTVTTSFGVGNTPVFIAFTPDGAKAYVANTNSESVSVIDTATDTVIQTIQVGSQPVDIAITP